MSASDDLVGGRYRLVGQLGRGGMGVVWAGRDEVLHRDVAVKEVRLPVGLSPQEEEALRARSLREARAAARISSPYVVTVHDVVAEDGRTWIVMQRLVAPTLAELLRSDGTLLPARAAEIGISVLEGLLAAHEVGVLHRDVKPSNVMVTADRAVLTDFGVASLADDASVTHSGMLIGSPGYMSPERARGRPATPASDLWALGATLYAAVEGVAPFDRGSALETLLAVTSGPAPAAPRAGALQPVLRALLEEDPADRPDGFTARSMLEAAHRLAGSGDERAAAGSTVPLSPREGRAVPGVEELQQMHVAPPAAPPERWQEAPLKAASSPSPAAGTASPTGLRMIDRQTLMDAHRRRRVRRRVVLALCAAVAVAVAVLLGYSTLRSALSAASGGAPEPAVVPPAATGAAPQVRKTPRASTDPRTSTAAEASSAPQTSTAPETSTSPRTRTTPRATATTTPQATPTTTAGRDRGPTPSGFTTFRDDAYRVAVPEGWSSRLGQIPERRIFTSPTGSRFLQVEYTDDPRPDPYANWLEYEPTVAQSFDGYERVSLERVAYRGWDTADWEFTWQGRNGRIHVLNRNIRIDDERAFSLYWSVPDDEWDELLADFDVVAATFDPR